MEIFLKADTWLALLTLCFLEIVLGIDNIIFISIVSNKLPEHQRQRARNLGLFLAMFVRIIFLLCITWIIQFKEPLFAVNDFMPDFLINFFQFDGNHTFSGRDLILGFGGLFLIAKSTMEINHEMEGDEEEEDDEEDLDKALRDTADPLPYRGGEWQGDPVDKNQKKKAHKKGNDKKDNKTPSCDVFDNRDEDASIFASINGDDLKKEVAKNVKSSMKTNTVDIYITGPFRNAKTGKSIWIAVFGDYGSAWTLKSQFLKGYIGALLKRIKMPNIDIGHTDSFYDINIRKYEYGKESLWRRKDQSKTTKRLSFVYTCETTDERNGKQSLIDAVQFFFKTMKKREINPIGPLVVEFLKEHASSLYDYLLRKKPNEEMIAEDITDDIDKHFRAGFVSHWDDHLNHWMVDYDIIRILKDYVGYSSWTDVPAKQRGLCYKNYNQNATLPEWDIDQERY